jgi:hypothetical protein
LNKFSSFGTLSSQNFYTYWLIVSLEDCEQLLVQAVKSPSIKYIFVLKFEEKKAAKAAKVAKKQFMTSLPTDELLNSTDTSLAMRFVLSKLSTLADKTNAKHILHRLLQKNEGVFSLFSCLVAHDSVKG